jgi:hypothetical protein
MKAILTFALAVILAGSISLPAQQLPAVPTPLEPVAPNTPAVEAPPAAPDEPSLAKQWRDEVLAWKDPQRVEEGTTTPGVSVINRSLLILGTVNGNVSTVSGNIAVLGTVNGNVSATSGTVTVLGTVNGNVSTVSGDLRVAGKITGSTSTVGGKIDTAPGAQLLGPSSSTIHGKWNIDFGNSSGSFNFEPDSGSFIHDFWLSPFMLLLRSGLLIFWVALSSAMTALFQPAILRGQSELRQSPGRCAALGFLWIILFWILFLACLVLSMILIGLPLLVVLIAFDMALGVFGMTLAFSGAGEWLARRLNHANPSIYTAVFIGACFLGLLRLIPIAGSFIWFAASLFGVGATLASRFGAAPTPSTPPAAATPLAIPA